MELFPSMTYDDVMAMSFKEFRMLHQIRIKRKLEEQEQMEKERKKLEQESKRGIINKSGRLYKTK